MDYPNFNLDGRTLAKAPEKLHLSSVLFLLPSMKIYFWFRDFFYVLVTFCFICSSNHLIGSESQYASADIRLTGICFPFQFLLFRCTLFENCNIVFAALSGDMSKLLLAAKKIRRATCTEFLISLVADDFSRTSNTYIGKL